MRREWRPVNPRPKPPPSRAGLAVFITLAILAAFLGATFGHIYGGVRAIVLSWYDVPAEP